MMPDSQLHIHSQACIAGATILLSSGQCRLLLNTMQRSVYLGGRTASWQFHLPRAVPAKTGSEPFESSFRSVKPVNKPGVTTIHFIELLIL